MTYNFAKETLLTGLENSDRFYLSSHEFQTEVDVQLAAQSRTSAAANSPQLDGAGGQKAFRIARGSGKVVIENFGGIGARDKQTPAVLAELDTLSFEGSGLTAQNLLLTQQGHDLVITFERVFNTQVVLKNFRLENLDNYPSAQGWGNILFEGDRTIQDSFDVFDSNWQRNQILDGVGLNRVTFLNDLNNTIQGFDRSDDTINGQAGHDFINGLSGDDILRGGTGNDTLYGGTGNDILWSGIGQDYLFGGKDSDIFALSHQEGTDFIQDFNFAEGDRIGLAGGLTVDQLVAVQGTGNYANAALLGTKTGELLAVLNGVQASDLSNSAFLTLTAIDQVISQGDRTMRSDVARERFGVDGTGITIGVISDSFNNLGTAIKDVISGDLPTNIRVLQDLTQGGTDEGRAIIQLIHDIAPGANLLFQTGGQSQADFAQGVQALVNAGVDIIIDDLVYFDEPMFQDGRLAQAVNQAAARGVAYFTSAGNNARDSYESSFRVAQFFSGYGDVHDFDPGPGVDIYQSITIAESDRPVSISFQWDAPLSNSLNDLDIYLLDHTKRKIVAQSRDSNVGSDPIEVLRFKNDGSYGSNEFNILIAKREGPAPNLIKYIAINSSSAFQVNEYNTNSSTVFGHKNTTGVAAVGAVPYYHPTRLEDFSSIGGTPILFDRLGRRLAQPELRQQPRFVAPDNGNTTFFGRDIPEDADRLPNFSGTSAAAPHAAAVAALMLQANPNLTPADIYTALAQTAQDLDHPYTPNFDQGFDTASGYGLIQADLAIARVMNPAIADHTVTM